MASETLVYTGLHNGLVLSGTVVDFSSVRFCNIDLTVTLQWLSIVLCNEFENYTFEIISISPRGQWLKQIICE